MLELSSLSGTPPSAPAGAGAGSPGHHPEGCRACAHPHGDHSVAGVGAAAVFAQCAVPSRYTCPAHSFNRGSADRAIK